LKPREYFRPCGRCPRFQAKRGLSALRALPAFSRSRGPAAIWCCLDSSRMPRSDCRRVPRWRPAGCGRTLLSVSMRLIRVGPARVVAVEG
jgi:hypothetical protein